MVTGMSDGWFHPARAVGVLALFACGLLAADDSGPSVAQRCDEGQLDAGFCACIAQEYPDEPYADCLLSLVAANQIDLGAAQEIADLIGPTGILERSTNSRGAACYTDICRVPYCGAYNPQCVHRAPLCVDWDVFGNCVSGYGCERDPWTGYFLCGGDNGTADTAGCYEWDGRQICASNLGLVTSAREYSTNRQLIGLAIMGTRSKLKSGRQLGDAVGHGVVAVPSSLHAA